MGKIKLTEKQSEWLRNKFDRGYTLNQLGQDLELGSSNIGEWENGYLFDAITESDFLEFYGTINETLLFDRYSEDIDDWLEKNDLLKNVNLMEYAKKVQDENTLLEIAYSLPWDDRKFIYKLLEELNGDNSIMRLKEEIKKYIQENK